MAEPAAERVLVGGAKHLGFGGAAPKREDGLLHQGGAARLGRVDGRMRG